jgi:very-short-patch-repair endonuclease
LPRPPAAFIRTDDPGGIEAYWHKRFEFLSRYNVRVLRFENRTVFEHPDVVLQAIKGHLTTQTTTPNPS